MRKFTDEDIRTIRAEYVHKSESRVSPNLIELANRYGASQAMIRKIAKGIAYSEVK